MSVVAACAALAGVAALAALTPPLEAAGSVRQQGANDVPLVRADAVCPEVRSDKDSQTHVVIAAPGAATAAGVAPATSPASAPPRTGRAELRELDAAQPHVSLSQPGAAVITRPGDRQKAKGVVSPPMVAVGEGALAPGLGAAVVMRTVRGELRGLAGITCVSTDNDFWFVGSGAVIGQRGRLYLTNPAAAPAVVDVALYGPDGPIKVPAARGITVAAGAQEIRLLDALSPSTTRFGIHVQVRQGRVAASLRDHQVRGLDPRGVDWVPSAAAPARRVVVPGVPGGGGERLLQVLAPGDADAIVRVRLLEDEGSFVPAGADVLEVPAGSVAELDLAPALAEKEMAVELTSDVPVTAGLLARTAATGRQLEDLAYTAAARALTPEQPGIVAPASLPGPVKTHVALAAPGEGATVTVSTLAPARGSRQRVQVRSGAQTTLDLSRVTKDAGASVLVVPAPGSGPVVAARITEETGRFGRLLTVSPVVPGRYVVRVPRVVTDLSTGLRVGRCAPAC